MNDLQTTATPKEGDAEREPEKHVEFQVPVCSDSLPSIALLTIAIVRQAHHSCRRVFPNFWH